MEALVPPALLPTTELVALWRRLGSYPNFPDRKPFGAEDASSPIEIVPFQPRYREGIASVILPIQQSELSIPITLDAQPDLQDIPGHYQKDHGNFWVALDQERVVGTVALLDIGYRQGALRKMFVSRAYRGASQGVSGPLVETLLAWCRERGLRQVFLGMPSKFPAAHRFYEKHGFRPIAREELPARFPAMVLDDRFYVRTL
jgi:N-acetylglutamate synthase-like GNAT family acetyltransferase